MSMSDRVCVMADGRLQPETARALRLSLLVHGVDLSGSLGGVLSAAHTADDLEDTAAALARAIDMMRAEGLAPAIP